MSEFFMLCRETPEHPLSGASPDGTDREQLDRFIKDGDETAFANLMHRHAATVYGVCRRVLANAQDSEDAFQAVFLVLAKKAKTISKREAVGSWLYGVAYRTAMRAKRTATNRHKHEQRAPAAPPQQAPANEASFRELQRFLDEEVERLPEKLRVPFILCCLQGMSKAEAARELGSKEGTVSGRVTQARQLLQKRLTRRGISFTATLTVFALTQDLAAAAPPLLVQTTAQAVAASFSGHAAGGVISPAASALAEGLMRTMALAKVKALFAVVLTALLVVGSAGVARLALGFGGQEAAVADAQGVNEPEGFLEPPVPLLVRADEQVLAVAFAPDGRKLVTAGGRFGRPGQLKLWDVASGKELLDVQRIPGVRTVAYSPDGETLATGDVTGKIRLRRADTLLERASVVAHEIGVNGLAYSADGALLASAGLDRSVKVWDAQKLNLRQAFTGHTDMVFSVAFFRHGRAIVTCSKDKTAKIWDLATGKEKFTLAGHREGIETVAIAPDDKTVATASWDRTVKLWDAETGKEIAILPGSASAVFTLAFSPQGDSLATGTGDGMVRLWDLKTRKAVGNLTRHAAIIWALAFSPDGKLLASGSSDTSAKLWDLPAGREVSTLVTGSPRTPITALAYAPNGKSVAVATEAPAVELRDAQTGVTRQVFAGHIDVVHCLAFAPDGKTLASGSADKTIKIWDPATGTARHTLPGHGGEVKALAFTPDAGSLISAGDDNVIRIWDPQTGKESATLQGHKGSIRTIACSRQGRKLASAGDESVVKVWDLDKLLEVATLNGHDGTVWAITFSSTGELASAGEDGTVKVWDIAQRKERLTLRGHAGPVLSVAFSPEGQLLVSGGHDKTVCTWNVADGTSRGTLHGHNDAVTALAIEPLGNYLLSGSADSQVLRWVGKPAVSPGLTLRDELGGIMFAVFSPGGERLASGGESGSVTLWSRSLEPARFPFARQGGVFLDAAFSPDDRFVALGTPTEVLVCDSRSCQKVRGLPMAQDAHCVAFSPDGRYLAAGTGIWNKLDMPSENRLFDVATGKELAKFQVPSGMTYRVSFSPDGKILAALSHDKKIRLWEVPSGKLVGTLTGHERPARGMVFLPDGTLVTAGLDRTIRFWDTAAGKERKAWQTGLALNSVAVSPDGTLLAAAEGAWESKGPARLQVWDIANAKVKLALAGHDTRIIGLAFTPDGRGLVAVGGKPGTTGSIHLWDLANGQLRATQKTTSKWFENVAVSATGKRMISTSLAGYSLWDLEFGQKERTWSAHLGTVQCGLFLDDGKILATGGADKLIKLWNAATGEAVASLHGHGAAVQSLAVLPDKKTLLSAGLDKCVKLWNLASFAEKATLTGPTQPVLCLALAPDGKVLATGGGERNAKGSGELILWDLAASRQLFAFPRGGAAVTAAVFSPDGTWLAAGYDAGPVKIWEVPSHELRATLPARSTRSLRFTGDGKFLITANEDEGANSSGKSEVLLWDTTAWKRLAVLQQHQKVIHSIDLSADGMLLATASQEGAIKISALPTPGKKTIPVAAAAAVKVPLGDAQPADGDKNEPIDELPSGPGKSALVIVEVLALALVATALALWFVVRWRRQAGAPPPDLEGGNLDKTRAAEARLLVCAGCGKRLKIKSSLAGRAINCPGCGKRINVPESVARPSRRDPV